MFARLFNKRNGDKGYTCTCCGKFHRGLPSLTFNSPDHWSEEYAAKNPEKNELNPDFCVIDHKDFFIRVRLEIPIIDSDKVFSWGVWVSLSEENFLRYNRVFGTKKELKEKPYFGWFCNRLPGYPDTLGLKTSVQLQGDKLRPLIILDHSNPHPLCQEQHMGITMKQAHEILESAKIEIK